MDAKNLIRIDDLDRQSIDDLFSLARKIRRSPPTARLDKSLATLFFQPSTRTRFSFEAAMHHLGGTVLSFGDPDMTRAGKSWHESLGDTAQMISQYADILVMRHASTQAIHELARFASVPVINAGNGIGADSEHPTQALADGLTILNTFGAIDGIRVLMSGGLLQRTTNSLLALLNKYSDVTVYCFAPPNEDRACLGHLQRRFANLTIEPTACYDAVIESVDVLYLNSISETRSDPVPKEMVLTRELAGRMMKQAIILHPLPRGEELPQEVDRLQQAKYFEQAATAVPLRMALISMML